jgi:hypothetical protein
VPGALCFSHAQVSRELAQDCHGPPGREETRNGSGGNRSGGWWVGLNGAVCAGRLKHRSEESVFKDDGDGVEQGPVSCQRKFVEDGSYSGAILCNEPSTMDGLLAASAVYRMFTNARAAHTGFLPVASVSIVGAFRV